MASDFLRSRQLEWSNFIQVIEVIWWNKIKLMNIELTGQIGCFSLQFYNQIGIENSLIRIGRIEHIATDRIQTLDSKAFNGQPNARGCSASRQAERRPSLLSGRRFDTLAKNLWILRNYANFANAVCVLSEHLPFARNRANARCALRSLVSNHRVGW